MTKASLKQNWANELAKWLVRPMRIAIQHSNEPWLGDGHDVLILNFDIAHKFKAQLHSTPWDAAIVDEATHCKNRKARRTEVVLGAPKRQKKVDGQKVMLPPEPGIPARFKMALTGTPIEARPEEVYTMLRWLDPDRWPSFWKFANRYCGATFDGYGSNTQGATHLDELQLELRRTLMLRRLRADVLPDLPGKTRMIVEMEPDAECLAAINAEQRVMGEFEDDLTEGAVEVEMAKLDGQPFEESVKKMAEGRRLAFTEIARVRHATAVAKVPLLIEAIQDDIDSGGIKMLVFAHHKDVLGPLHESFPGSVLITGDTPPDDRQAIVDRFQTDPGCGPFFGSIRACGEGLTLTAATVVSFCEEDWTPSKISQCEDRAVRIGQRFNVLVKHFVLRGSIDVKMAKTHVAKQEVIDQALDRDIMVVEGKTPILAIEAGSVLDQKPVQPGDKPEPVIVVTNDLRTLIHDALKALAGVCNYAQSLDGAGFNKFDAAFGHALAERNWLTDKMVLAGVKLCWKYSKQLGPDFKAQLQELTEAE